MQKSKSDIPRMADLIARHDWAFTPLGAIENWPQSLKTTVDIMLGSGHAMQLAWGPKQTVLYNDAYAPMLGNRHPGALGIPFHIAWPEIWEDIKPLVERVFAGETVRFEDMPLVMTRHGYPEDTWWNFSYSPVRDESGAVAGLLNVTVDATGRMLAKRAEAALRESEERFRVFVNASSDVVYRMSADWSEMRELDGRGFLADAASPIRNWRDAYIRPEDLAEVDLSIRRAIDTKSMFELEHRILRANGTIGWTSSRAAPVIDERGEIVEWLGTASDITERKRLEHELRHSAFHDALTGQPNRALFMDRLGHVIARTERHGEGFALLMLDIDNFKLINDSFGHPAGDRLLIEFSQSVRRYLRPQDTLARLGGDEFCILVEEIESREDVLQVARRIQRRLGEQSIFVQGQEIRTSVSIGIAFERSGHRKPETALQDADIALYEAKRRGKNGYVIFDQGLRQGARAPLRLERALQRAITAGEITVEYQPIVDLATGRPIGCEALARWRHPQLGPVEPAQFIPLAEETGVIRPLGQFILETACREFAQWRQLGELPGDFYVAVNLSAHQFGQDDLVEQVIGTLNRFGLEGRNLRLEVTESSIIANGERAARVIGELQDHGIRVCMDDFGVGYSSLSYLQRFPVSVLKLDRSFVSGLTEQPNTQAIVKTVLDLARNLGLEAVAEGAECNEQRDALRALGFTHAQGFLFHHPMCNEAMAGLVTRH